MTHPARPIRQTVGLALALLCSLSAAAEAQRGSQKDSTRTSCPPGQVCTQSVPPPGGDTSPPAITFSPGTSTTFYSPAQLATVSFCDNASLNQNTRTITFNGATAPHAYTSTTRTGCGAYGYAQVSLTLRPGADTLAASICDGSGNCTTRSVIYIYANNADQTAPTVQITPGTQTTSTASFFPAITWCDERKLGTAHTITFNGADVTAGWTFQPQDGVAGCNARATSSGPVQLRSGDNTLVAQVQDSAGNTGSKTVVYTYRPTIDTSPTNQTGVTRQISDAVVTYATAAYRSLDQDRSVTLVYSSLAARPTAMVQVDVTDNAGNPAPVTSLGLTWHGAMQTLPDGRTELHYATGQGASRLTAVYGATATPTGSREMSAIVTRKWAGGVTEQLSVPIRLVVLNLQDSELGAGWGIAGVERVIAGGEGGILVAHGDATATFYPAYTSCNLNRVCYFGHTPGDFGSMAYDSANARYVRTSRDGVASTFNAAGFLTSVQDRLGNAQTYGYANGRLATITDPAGLATTFGYDAAGKLASVTDPAGRVTLVVVNAAGDLASITDPDGVSALQLTYASHRVESYTQRGGRQWTVGYDAFGRMASLQSPAFTAEGGQTFRLSTGVVSMEMAAEGNPNGGTAAAPLPRVDPATLRVSTTDVQGRVTRYRLDPWGAPARVEDPRGYATTATRNAEGQVTTETDAAGNQTTYVWSGGDVSQVISPSGTVNYAYNGAGDVTDAWGATPTLKNFYNPATGVLDSTDVAGQKTRYTHDGRGRVLAVTDAQGHVSASAYPDTSRWKNVASETAGGRTVSYRYDGYGRVAGVKAPDGRETTVQYDLLNRTRFVTTPDNATTEYVWGQVFLDRATDARGQSYQWTRNALGWVEREVRPGDPAGKNLTAGYDRYGRVSTTTNRRNQAVSFTYDTWNRVATRTADGQTTTFGYSPDDPAHPNAPTWVSVANPESVDTVRYDGKGRLTDAVTVRPFAGTWQRFAVQPRYNAIDQLTGVGIATPAGRDSLGYGYNAQTYRLQSFSDLSLGSTSIAYSGEGLPEQTTLPNGLIATQQYSSTHMPEEVRYPFNVLLDNAAGVRYRYDSLNRIRTRMSADGGFRRELTYDPAGRWLNGSTDWQATGSGSPTCGLSADDGYVCDNSTATWNATATETYAYDLTGNPTDRGAVLGAGNRLSQFNGYALTYDDDGNLASKTGAGFSQTFTWTRWASSPASPPTA